MSDEPIAAILSFDAALNALADPDEVPTTRHIHALSGPTAEDMRTWTSLWPTIDRARQREIVALMLETAEAEFQVDFRLLFIDLLADPDPPIRAVAVDGLWEAENPFLIDRFADLLAHDEDDHVRARAAAGLGHFIELSELGKLTAERTAGALNALVEAGLDEGEDPEVRRRAIESAGYADRADVRSLIEQSVATGDRVLCAGALRAMGHSADPRWGTEVLAWLEESDRELCYEAAHAAGELGLRKAVPQLAQLAEFGNRQVQLEAIWALGEIGGRIAQRALKDLAESLEDDDDEIEEAFDNALANLALADGVLDWEELGVQFGHPGGSGNGHDRERGTLPLDDDEEDDPLSSLEWDEDELEDWDDEDDDDEDIDSVDDEDDEADLEDEGDDIA